MNPSWMDLLMKPLQDRNVVYLCKTMLYVIFVAETSTIRSRIPWFQSNSEWYTDFIECRRCKRRVRSHLYASKLLKCEGLQNKQSMFGIPATELTYIFGYVWYEMPLRHTWCWRESPMPLLFLSRRLRKGWAEDYRFWIWRTCSQGHFQRRFVEASRYSMLLCHRCD